MEKDIVLVSIYSFTRKDITTMKKVLFSAATALMLTAMTAIPALAAGSENWVAGPGFISNGSEDGEYPVTITETDAGIQVSHGGYYQTGENWGGAAYLVPIELDGARVEITLDMFPEGNHDCWFSVDFLTKPELFYAGDNFSDNPGIVILIRFATPQFQAFGPDSFTLIANTDDDKKSEEVEKITNVISTTLDMTTGGGENAEITMTDYVGDILDSSVLTETIVEHTYDENGELKDNALNTDYTYVPADDEEKAELEATLTEKLAASENKEDTEKAIQAIGSIINVQFVIVDGVVTLVPNP